MTRKPYVNHSFNLALQVIIRGSGIQRSGIIYDKRHQNLALADDLTFVTRTVSKLKKMTVNLIKEAKRMELPINEDKTKLKKMKNKEDLQKD